MNQTSEWKQPSSMPLADGPLVEAAKRGDHLAYIELSNHYAPRIFRVVSRITKNREDAEDALQESLMKAFIHLRSFDGRSSFSTWLTRIAINSALMVLRKKRTRLESSFENDFMPESLLFVDSSPGPEKLYIERERELNLTRAIGRLPKSLRQVIEIRNSQDASVREVAEIAGISVAATKSRLLRARKTLTASMN